MRAAAEAASKSANPAWADDSDDKGTDGVPHTQNLYGQLNTRADTAVTEADLARCHLCSSVRPSRTPWWPASRAPAGAVRQPGRHLQRCVEFPGTHLALGLLYYNPPLRSGLVFWVASHDPGPTRQVRDSDPVGWRQRRHQRRHLRADLLVMDATGSTIVAARSFDSRWRWRPIAPDRRCFPLRSKTQTDFAVAMAGRSARPPARIWGRSELLNPRGSLRPLGQTRVATSPCCIISVRSESPICRALSWRMRPEFCRERRVSPDALHDLRDQGLRAPGGLHLSRGLPSALLWRFSQTAKLRRAITSTPTLASMRRWSAS